MKQTEQKKFSTLEIHLAAFLELHKIPAELENNGGRIIFTFPRSDEVYRLTDAYNCNEPVPVTDYVSVLRILKARMFSMREQKRETLSGSRRKVSWTMANFRNPFPDSSRISPKIFFVIIFPL